MSSSSSSSSSARRSVATDGAPSSPGRLRAGHGGKVQTQSALREALLPSGGGGPLLELRAPGDDAAGGFALDLQRVYTSINASVCRHVRSLHPVRASKDLLAVLELVVNESVAQELATCKMRLSSKSRLDHYLHYVVNLLCVPFMSSVFGQGALSNLIAGSSSSGDDGRSVFASFTTGLTSAVTSMLQWDAESTHHTSGYNDGDGSRRYGGSEGGEDEGEAVDPEVAALRVLLCDMLALFVIAELLHDRGMDASALDAAYVELAISLLLYRSTPLVPLYLTLSSCGLDIMTPITCQVLSVRALAEDVRSSIDTLLVQCSDALLAGDGRGKPQGRSSKGSNSSSTSTSATLPPREALRAPLLQYLCWLRASREPLVRMCRVAEVTAFLDDRLCNDLKSEDYGSPQDVVTEYRTKYKERLSIIPLPVQPVTAFDATQAQRDVVRELLAVNGELVDAAFVNNLVVRRFDSSTGHHVPIAGRPTGSSTSTSAPTSTSATEEGEEGCVDVKVLADTSSWSPDHRPSTGDSSNTTTTNVALQSSSSSTSSNSESKVSPEASCTIDSIRLYIQSLVETAIQDKIKSESAVRTGAIKAAHAAASAVMSDMLEIASDSTDSENEAAAWGRSQRHSSDSSSSGGSSLFPAISVTRPGSGSSLSPNIALMLSNRSMYNVIVDRVLQQVLIACSRTIAGGDAYSVLDELYGGPGLLLCPRRSSSSTSSSSSSSTGSSAPTQRSRNSNHSQLPDVVASVSIRVNDRGICVIVKSVFDLFEIADGSVTSQSPLVSFKARTTTVIRYPNTDMTTSIVEPWRLKSMSNSPSSSSATGGKDITSSSDPSSRSRGPTTNTATSTSTTSVSTTTAAAADRALRASLRRAMLEGMGDILTDPSIRENNSSNTSASNARSNSGSGGNPLAKPTPLKHSQPRIPSDLERSQQQRRGRGPAQDPAKSASINDVLQRFLMEDTQVYRGLYIEPYLDKAMSTAS